MVNLLEEISPGLAKSDYRITSPTDADSNCIAWAAGDSGNWWWPGPDIALGDFVPVHREARDPLMIGALP
jgi:hypothetical protein